MEILENASGICIVRAAWNIMLRCLRDDKDFVPELDFVMENGCEPAGAMFNI